MKRYIFLASLLLGFSSIISAQSLSIFQIAEEFSSVSVDSVNSFVKYLASNRNIQEKSIESLMDYYKDDTAAINVLNKYAKDLKELNNARREAIRKIDSLKAIITDTLRFNSNFTDSSRVVNNFDNINVKEIEDFIKVQEDEIESLKKFIESKRKNLKQQEKDLNLTIRNLSQSPKSTANTNITELFNNDIQRSFKLTSQAQVLDALSQFIIDRAKEEMTLTFYRYLANELDASKAKSFRLANLDNRNLFKLKDKKVKVANRDGRIISLEIGSEKLSISEQIKKVKVKDGVLYVNRKRNADLTKTVDSQNRIKLIYQGDTFKIDIINQQKALIDIFSNLFPETKKFISNPQSNFDKDAYNLKVLKGLLDKDFNNIANNSLSFLSKEFKRRDLILKGNYYDNITVKRFITLLEGLKDNLDPISLLTENTIPINNSVLDRELTINRIILKTIAAELIVQDSQTLLGYKILNQSYIKKNLKDKRAFDMLKRLLIANVIHELKDSIIASKVIEHINGIKNFEELIYQMSDLVYQINWQVEYINKKMEQNAVLSFEDYKGFLTLIFKGQKLIYNSTFYSQYIGKLDSIQMYYLDLITSIHNQDYYNAVYNSINFYASSNIGMFGESSEYMEKLRSYIFLMADIANSKTTQQINEGFKKTFLPAGSSSIKRNSKWNISLNSFVGAFGGSEKVSTTFKPVLGFSTPVGFTFNRSFKHNKCNPTFGLHLNLIDIGALVSYRFTGETSSIPIDESIGFASVFSPGALLMWHIPKAPISVGAGYSFTPSLRKVSNSGSPDFIANAHRFSVGIYWDLPLLTIYNRKY